MMDHFFVDPEEVRLPPAEVRIRDFRLEPWADGRRVRVTVEVDAFQKRPSLELVIWNAMDEIVAEAMVIESISRKIECNMHLRQPEPAGIYRAQAVLYYQTLPEGKDDEPAPAEFPARQQVDMQERNFEITS